MNDYEMSQNDLFFDSEEDQLNFQMVEQSPLAKFIPFQNQMDYIGSFLDFGPNFQQFQEKDHFQDKPQDKEATPDRKVCDSETGHEAQQKQFFLEIMPQNEESQFTPYINKSVQRKKKQRASDQNLCKRYHTVANKCLRSLKIYKHISSLIEKVHKRTYLIIALIVAQKLNKLPEFIALYSDKVSEMSNEFLKTINNSFNGSIEYKKSKQNLSFIASSLSAMKLFKEGKLEQSIKELYDTENMKRTNWVHQAFNQVLQLSNTLQLV